MASYEEYSQPIKKAYNELLQSRIPIEKMEDETFRVLLVYKKGLIVVISY
jgi:hypothetical protein